MEAVFKRYALVVEDFYLVALKTADALHAFGYTDVTIASGVAQARNAISERRPDLVTLDIQLSDGDVGPLLDVLKARSIPFFYVTGFERPHQPEPAVPWLTKPLDRIELAQAIATVTGGALPTKKPSVSVEYGGDVVLPVTVNQAGHSLEHLGEEDVRI